MESLSPQTQQPIPTKVPPTVESSVIKNGLSWKFSILSGIVVLIVIILGSGAYLSHSVDTYDECIQYYPVIQSFPPHCVNARGEYFFEPDDPLLWKTYSNQEYGFELQYPPFLVLNNNFSDIVSNSENGYNFLVCLDEPNELPETICLDTIEKSFLDDEIKRASGDVKDIPIGDKKYLNYKFSGYYGGSDKYAIPLNDSNYLVISKRWSEGSTPRSFDLDYLLSTLKFTNTVVDTSGWKTYYNDKYKYSIKYPSNWSLYDKGTYGAGSTPFDPKRIVIISPSPIAGGKLSEGDFGFNKGISIQFAIGPVPTEGRVDGIIDDASCLKRVATKESDSGFDPATNYFCEANNVTFSISFENTDYQGTHDYIFDQIINTIRLTK